ncbi:hypothetical protein L195_g050957, partial [Trifolium pratense]
MAWLQIYRQGDFVKLTWDWDWGWSSGVGLGPWSMFLSRSQ